jgi:hypothetical protein
VVGAEVEVPEHAHLGERRGTDVEHEMCPSYKDPYDTCLTGNIEYVPHKNMQYY